MLRWIAALSAALLLGGCVTTREYVYTNDPSRDGYRERVYDDGSYADTGYSDGSYAEGDRYYSDGTYYSSSSGSSGDYYYREPDYYYGTSYYSSSYFDYPAYYSIFHPINSWWYDPYYYPSYYYGVTYFPRNYLSISFGYPRGHGWSHYGYASYSPYRYSWVDNYYDWEPWYRNYPRYRDYYPTPRYGSARREAERLASWSDSRNYYNQHGGLPRDGRYNNVRRTNDPTANYGNARNGQRGADYGSRTAPRQDPGTRGFGVPTDVRRNGSARDGSVRGADYGNNGTRQIPSRGFGVQPDNTPRRGADYGNGNTRQIPNRGFGVEAGGAPRSNGGVDSGVRRGADYGGTRDVERVGDVRRNGDGRAIDNTPVRTQPRSYSTDTPAGRRNIGDNGRVDADRRGYDLPSTAPRRYVRPTDSAPRQAPAREVRSYDEGNRGYSVPAAQPRRYEAPAAQQAPRGYGQSAPRSYSAPAPAPNYSAPSPAPQRETYSAPPRESYSPPPRESSRDSGSSRGDSGNVRRVGSNRDDR